MGADAALGGVKKAEKGRGFFSGRLRVGVTVGKCFRAQVESAKIACGNYGDGGMGNRKLQLPKAPKELISGRTRRMAKDKLARGT